MAEAMHEGGHRGDGGVLTSRIVDMVATKGKVCRTEGSALRFYHTHHARQAQSGGEEEGGHGKVKVPAARKCMGS